MNQQVEQVELAAKKRVALGKRVKQLRREGWVPAVMYGHSFDPVSLQFEERNLTKLLSHVGGSQLISIKVEGQKQPEMALVRDVQRDVIRGTLLHVDFYRVDMAERLTTEIPLTLVGESPVIESKEGILLQGLSSIEVECLPGDLVDAIAVDLSDLGKVGDGVHVRDLAVPAGIDILSDLDEVVVRVVPLEEVVIEEEVEEEALLPGVEEGEEVSAEAVGEGAAEEEEG